MGPCEEALAKLGAAPKTKDQKSQAPALQIAPPSRLYRFEGEVPESCEAMLRKWKVCNETTSKTDIKIEARGDTKLKGKMSLTLDMNKKVKKKSSGKITVTGSP